MVHKVENRISGIERQNQNENHTVSIFVDVVSKLSSYIINNKYYFQIVTVLNFQQSIIMNIINSPERHLKCNPAIVSYPDHHALWVKR